MHFSRIITFSFMLLISLFSCSPTSNLDNSSDCENLNLDLSKGTMNEVKPSDSQRLIKKTLPCFTGVTEEGGIFHCGGGVFYENHGMSFYSKQNFLIIDNTFSGRSANDLIGKDSDAVKAIFGDSYTTLEGQQFYLYAMDYGTLIFKFKLAWVDEIQIHYNTKPENVVLCQ